MIQRVGEKQLRQLVCALAKRTRNEIEEAGLKSNDFRGIADKYDVALCWEELPLNNPGYYSKDERKIVLNSRITNQERLNFTFFHELIHHLVEHDDEILTLLADAYIASDYDTMERMCNAGAAELLMPSEDVRQVMRTKGFSAALIPELCQRFQASSLAVAFQLVNLASHKCHLVIAEPLTNGHDQAAELIIIYTGRSPAEDKYSVARGHALPERSLLYEVWQLGEGESKQAEDCIPFASGTEWVVPCDAFRFCGKVFAFFNVEPSISPNQMTLL